MTTNTTIEPWVFPLHLDVVGVTQNSMSFKNLAPNQVEIPIGNHCGAFGIARRHDVHKGVDLYAPHGTPVYAVENGTVVEIRWFTGEKAGFPWWNNTQAISIEGESGVVVYGEVEPVKDIKVGDMILDIDQIGTVATVLAKDKGRPMSMLHFALHHHNVLGNGRWLVGKPQPIGLMDPTNRLIKAVQ